MAVNITTDTNTVKVTATTTNKVTVVDNENNTVVTVSQPTTRVIKVATAGPQGPPGPSGSAGPSGSIDTGSLLTTTSFNAYTGSSTSQFAGTSSYALTASFALNAGGGGSTFPFTGSALITGSLGVTGSTSILSGSLTVNSVAATNTLILSGSTPRIVFHNSGSTSSNSSVRIEDRAWGLKTNESVFRFEINGSGSAFPVGVININKSSNATSNIGIYPNGGSGDSGCIFISGSGNVGIKTDTPTSGTLHINGNVFANSYTGSLFGTASFVISSSYALSSSFAVSSSRAVTSSFAISSSQSQNAISASYSITSSFAISSSNIDGFSAATIQQINIGETNTGTYAYIVRAQELEQSKHTTINIYNNLNFI